MAYLSLEERKAAFFANTPEYLQEYSFPCQNFEPPGTKARLHYLDVGQGEPILFAHGTPGWSFEFRKQISQFSKTHRCIAFDHLGFGLSDRPGDAAYSFADHAKNFSNFIRHLGLKKFSLVVHDMSGPICLPFALANPDMITSLVIINSWFWPFETVLPGFARQRRFLQSGFMKWLYLKWNFSPKIMVKTGWGTSSPLSKKEHRFYQRMFPTADDRKGTYGVLRSILDAKSYFDVQAGDFEALRNIPSLVLWGQADRLLTAPFLTQWQGLLPDSGFHILEGLGHFPHVENSEQVNQILRDFFESRRHG